MPSPPAIFLSHNSEDKPVVREIAAALKRRRLQPWLDEEDLPPGRLWQDVAEEAIRTCRSAAVFVGQSGMGPWEREEVRALLTQAVRRGLAVIPVLLPGAPKKPELPLFLAERTWVDLRTEGVTPEGIDRLVWGITGKKPRAKSTAKPSQTGPPPLHNLPYSPLGDLFKGRDKELKDLAASLQGGKARAIVQDQRALYGLGGIGKTRLAVEYAWRFGSRYKAALFVRADSPESLNNGLASLAVLLGQPVRQAQDETVQAVLLWLQANPGWLMILDNVDSREAERAVLEILPRLTGGQALITSRLRGWPKTVSKQELDTVSLEEAQAFLLKRTDGERRVVADDEIQALRLAEKLDGLPLALEQAGAYISHTRLSFSEYLKIWDEEKRRVLEWHSEDMGYPASVAATWKTSFDRLQPMAATLLRLMAFLAPEPIPEVMFVESEARTVEALAELESYSLISREGAACSVHRVVQEVVQSQIPTEEQREWIGRTLEVVNGYSPFDADDVRTWPVWNVLRPHAARVVSLADESGVTVSTSRLMGQLGLYLKTRGLYAEAEPLMRRALAIGEATLGNDHPTVAIRLNNLAQLLKATNRLSEAEPLMRRALAIDEASFGNEHPNVAIDLNNLALLLQDTNRLSEAEPLMRRAVEIFEASLGPDHPKTKTVRRNLEILLAKMADGPEGTSA